MKRIVGVIVVAAVLAAAYSAAVVVDETQFAVVKRFGRPVRVLDAPGLHWKWPAPVETTAYLDSRNLVFEHPRPSMPFKEYLTREPKNVEVSSYACWRIGRDPSAILKFLRAVGTRENAEGALGDIVVAELGAVLGQYDLASLITTDASSQALAQLVAQVQSACDRRARESYGIEIIDFRLTRLLFPPQNRRSVFDRMRAERRQIATQYRSEGEAEAMRVRAEADRDRERILSEAYQQSEEIKGKADAAVTRIYADAYGQDPEFYNFLRTLESYETTLNDKTVVVFSADSPWLRMLRDGGAQRGDPTASSRPAGEIGSSDAVEPPAASDNHESLTTTTRPAR